MGTFYEENKCLTIAQRIILFNFLFVYFKEQLYNVLKNFTDTQTSGFFHGLPFFILNRWNMLADSEISQNYNRKETEQIFIDLIQTMKEKETELLSDDWFLNLSDDDSVFIHFIWELMLSGHNITADKAAEKGKSCFGLEVNCISDRVDKLITDGFLQPIKSGSSQVEYSLTLPCHILMVHVLTTYPVWKHVYNQLNKSALNSKIYRDYCSQTYGIDLCQLGQVTGNQLEKLIDVYEGDENSFVMEPGCGTGHISEYIYDRIKPKRYHSSDVSDYAIDLARNRNNHLRPGLIFDTANIYNLNYEKHYFDSIIAIDSLHYLLGLDDVLMELRTLLKPGGLLYTFWESWISDQSDLEMKKPETTRLGIVLSELDIEFESWDFTEDNKTAWDTTVRNLKLFKNDFYKDDATLIYESRLSETNRIDNSIDSSRFLYKIKLN